MHSLKHRSTTGGILFVALLLSSCCRAPCPPVIAARGGASSMLEHASFIESYAATYRYRLGRPRSFVLSPDEGKVFYLRSGPRSFSHQLFVLDVATGQERQLLTASKLLAGSSEQLSAQERARRERQRRVARGISSFRLSRRGDLLLVPLSGKLYLVRYPSLVVERLALGPGPAPLDARFSPDGRFISYVRAGDLFLLPITKGVPRRLTKRLGPGFSNGLAEFVAQEEMGRHRGYWWSPNSKSIIYQNTDTRQLERFKILDPLHPQRKVDSWPYPRAGKKNAIVRLFHLSTTDGARKELRWDRKRYPYLARVHWRSKAPPLLVVQNRAQTELLVLAVDLASGKTRKLLAEKDRDWVEIDRQMPKWLSDGSAFLWTSERGGHKRLWLYHADGRPIRALTTAQEGYRRLLDVDGRAKSFVFAGGPHPSETAIFRKPMALGSKAQRLPSPSGEHGATFGRLHGVYIHTAATLKGREVVVRTKGGQLLARIADRSEKPTVVPRPRFLTAELGSDPSGPARKVHAVVLRPRSLDPKARLPVVLYVYGGPGYRTVRKDASRYLLLQWIADQGFVVVSIDGRGTPHRGRAWSRALKGSFYRTPLADQVAGLRALGARFPEMDLSSVGVFGWSYGGYMALMALLKRSELFRAGVAGAPVTEWRDYDTHYTERYGGLVKQNLANYRDSSVLTHASKLRRPLLLVHGTADDNVYFSHSAKLAKALFRAGREFDFLPLAGFTHVVPESTTQRRLYERIVAHFRRHLSR